MVNIFCMETKDGWETFFIANFGSFFYNVEAYLLIYFNFLVNIFTINRLFKNSKDLINYIYIPKKYLPIGLPQVFQSKQPRYIFCSMTPTIGLDFSSIYASNNLWSNSRYLAWDIFKVKTQIYHQNVQC